MGILFLIATPIGNLKDITIRAIETLFSVDAIACEDTRRAGILLSQLRIVHQKLISEITEKKPHFISYFEGNELKRIPEIVTALKDGLSIALISDAGTPLVSDPGFKLVRECIHEGIRVESIPGPSSVISSLVSSGLPTDRFMFLGFPPKKSGKRKEFFSSVRKPRKLIQRLLFSWNLHTG